MEKVSFFTFDGDQLTSTWNPVRSGDYAKDCIMGRCYFLEVMEAISMLGNPFLLSRAIAGQIQSGVFDGCEIGFLQALTEHLTGYASNSREAETLGHGLTLHPITPDDI